MNVDQRCVLYATHGHDVRAFACAVASTRGRWKPVVVPPVVLDAAVKALEPEVVVVATHQPKAAVVLGEARQRYGDHRLVVDDHDLTALTKLLRAA